MSASATPQQFAPVLAALEADAGRHFQQGPVRLVPGVCEERPFSHIMRVDVRRRDNESHVGRVFVKLFKHRNLPGGPGAMIERVTQDYEATRRVHAWMSQHADLGAVPPVAYYPEHLAIVTEEVEGPTLLQYLQRHTRWFGRQASVEELTTTMATVGRWVRVFQQLEAGHARTTIDALRDYIDLRMQRLVGESRGNFSESDRRSTLAHIEALGRLVSEDELDDVTVHADMALGNVLVAGQRIVVLDFAMTKRGNRLLDLTRLFVQMDLLAVKPHVRRSLVTKLQLAMVAGFDSTLTPDSPLFRLLLLRHRINHLATLSVNRAAPAEALYNAWVRRHHSQWLTAELALGPRTGAGA